MGLHVVQHLWGLLAEEIHGLGRKLKAVLFHNIQSLPAGGVIRIGGAGSDHIQRIPDNIRKYDGKDPGRGAKLRVTSPLDSGKPLAYRVHLHNVRPAGQQLLGKVGQLLRRDKRLFKQRRTAPGKKEKDGVLRPQPRHKVDGGLGGPEGVFVRDRMPGLKDS